MALPSLSDLRKVTTEQVSAFFLILALALAGLGIIGWMSIKSFDDMIGVSVGVILIILAFLQSGFTVYWYMLEKRRSTKYHTNSIYKEIPTLETEVAF